VDDGIRRWAELTASCIELRRIGLRSEHPGEPDAAIEVRLRDEIMRARERRTVAYGHDA
jgi:hypothetical protein